MIVNSGLQLAELCSVERQRQNVVTDKIIFTRIVQFEKDLEVEIQKVRKNYLMELIRINQKLLLFAFLESCFARGK